MLVVGVVFGFLFGASVGSFLTVAVHRIPRGESVVSPPSHCPTCNRQLSWRDNIPVFGWAMLRGRCRYCDAPISIRYPLIELACGLAAVAVVLVAR